MRLSPPSNGWSHNNFHSCTIPFTYPYIPSGKPGKPEGPLEVSNVTKTGCKVKWKKPLDDGGTPIKEYEIEKYDVDSGKWIRVGKVPGDKEEMNIQGLDEGKEYKFRVTAINDEGDSEPLVTDRSIIAKNPFGKFKRYQLLFSFRIALKLR